MVDHGVRGNLGSLSEVILLCPLEKRILEESLEQKEWNTNAQIIVLVVRPLN